MLEQRRLENLQATLRSAEAETLETNHAIDEAPNCPDAVFGHSPIAFNFVACDCSVVTEFLFFFCPLERAGRSACLCLSCVVAVVRCLLRRSPRWSSLCRLVPYSRACLVLRKVFVRLVTHLTAPVTCALGVSQNGHSPKSKVTNYFCS